MHRTSLRRAIALLLLLMLAAGLLVSGDYLRTKGISWAGDFGSIGAFFVAVLVVMIPLWRRFLAGPPLISSEATRKASDALAISLRRQLEDEDRARRINDPRALPVQWMVTEAADSAMLNRWDQGREGSAFRSLEPGARGVFTDITKTYLGLQPRRLVILGEAGAGKSVLAMNLAHELILERVSGEPVPVLLSAATWEPGVDLLDWIEAELRRNYPSLSGKQKDASGVIKSMARSLTAGEIMPIIDGLDEIPEHHRAAAISKINAVGSKFPLVVTSRPVEYINAIALAGRPIAEASVVELLPLPTAEIKGYLGRATSAVPADRWCAVFNELEAEPQGALAAVLATPLMVFLCRTIYENADSRPSDLVDDSLLADREAVENHLLDAFIPAIYSGRGTVISQHRWKSRGAQRWLSFLASWLDQRRSLDLAWWRFNATVTDGHVLGPVIRAGILTSAAWVLGRWVLARNGEWRNGNYDRRAEVSHIILHGRFGSALLGALRDLSAQLRFRLTPSFVSEASSILSLRTPAEFIAKITLATFVVAVFACTGSASRIFIPKAFKLRPRIGALILALWKSFLAIGFFEVILVHVPLERTIVTILLPALILPGVVRSFVTPIDIAQTISPARALFVDRFTSASVTLLCRIAILASVYLFCGASVMLAASAWLVIALLCTIMFGTMTLSASGAFGEARVWLAVTRRMPWRAMIFLADARQRGVLRQVGAVYQFRHIRLQERLADTRRPRLSRLVSVVLSIVDLKKIESPFTFKNWLPRSTSVAFRGVWEHRFNEGVAAVRPGILIGDEVGGIYRSGPGLARKYGKAPDGCEWIMCALPGQSPVLVAVEVWQALREAAGVGYDAATVLGLPFIGEAVPPRNRIVPAGADWVELRGGSWGRGSLVRSIPGRLRWTSKLEPADATHSVSQELQYGWNQVELRLTAVAKTPWRPLQRTLTKETQKKIAASIRSSALAGAVAEAVADAAVPLSMAWQRFYDLNGMGDDGGLGCFYSTAGRSPAVLTAVLLSTGGNLAAGSERSATMAEARVEFRTAWFDAQRMAGIKNGTGNNGLLPIDQQVVLLSAAWEVATDTLLMAMQNTSAGPIDVELIVTSPRRFSTAGESLGRPPSYGFTQGIGMKTMEEASAFIRNLGSADRIDRDAQVREALAAMAADPLRTADHGSGSLE